MKKRNMTYELIIKCRVSCDPNKMIEALKSYELYLPPYILKLIRRNPAITLKITSLDEDE